MTAETIDAELVDLVDRAQKGDGAAFAQLYDRYVDQTFGYVYRRVQHRQTAEDLVSDVFLRAFRRLDSFEWQGVDLGAWIMTIARNRVHDHFKSARFRMERASERTPEDRDPTPDDDPERVAMGRDMARALGAALEKISDDHREVIELRFVHDRSVADTAAIMGRTIGATKALQYRALKSLAAEVKDTPGLSEIAALGVSGLLSVLRMLPL